MNLAFYIHSWYSWVSVKAIEDYLQFKSSHVSTLYILGRDFQLPPSSIKNNTQILRFESIENSINRYNYIDISSYLSTLPCFANNKKYHLFIPHIGYHPFFALANSNVFNIISFYQESIQLPDTTLIHREGNLLIHKNTVNSLYVSRSQSLQKKITNNYYYLNKEVIPLHLKGIKSGDITSSLKSYLFDDQVRYGSFIDFMLCRKSYE